MKLLTIQDYIENLIEFENHPMGKTQFLNWDFDFYPTNLPFGYCLKKDSKHCIIMAGCDHNLRLYRGENKDFPNFLPTIKRKNLEPGNTEHCFEWIKTEEFKKFFKESIYYKRLSEIEIDGCSFEPNLDALAQHYGFKTNYLDLTQSRLVAQFFAMTDYNKETGKFFPITDFKNNDYKPIIYDIKITDLYKLKPEAFKIIGIQPLMRPLQQFAYAVDTSAFNDELKTYFNKTELTPDPEGSKYIYEKFDGGKILFPDERIEDSVYTIRNFKLNGKNILPESLLHQYCINFKLNFNIIKAKMSKFYNITDKKKFVMFENETKAVDFYLTNHLLPFIKNNIALFQKMNLPPM